MLMVAIIEDNLQDCLHLQACLDRYLSEHPLRMRINMFSSAADFLAAKSRQTFQLVFVDVYLNGESGMELAHKLRDMDDQALLVFTSCSPDWAVESYRVRAHDYLIKPFDYAAFEQVMLLCDKALRSQHLFIQVKEGRMLTRILLEDILYTDYSNHYIQIHTRDRIIKTYMPFASFTELLRAHPRFLCCYRNMMVNMDHIALMDEKDFILGCGKRVPISRSNRHEIRQRYTDYQFESLSEGQA